MSTLTIETPSQAGPTSDVSAERIDTPRAVHGSVADSMLRGILALLSTQPLTWGTSLLAAAVMPRLLGAHALGQYTMVLSVTGLAGTALCLGIPDFLLRRIAQQPQSLRRDIGLALAIQLAAATIGAVLMLIASPWLESIVDLPLLYIGLVGMVAASAQFVLLAAYRGREKHVGYAWANAMQAAASTVVGVLVLAAGADVHVFAAVFVATSTLATLVGWRFVGFTPAMPALDRAFVRDAIGFIRSGFPFLAWTLTLCLFGNADRILLGFFVDATEIGWYSAAIRVVGATIFLPSIIVAPLFPVLSRSVNDPDTMRRTLAQTLRLALLVTVPLAAGIIGIGPTIPGVLGWPADFANAAPLMMILAVHIPVVAVDMMLASAIMALGAESWWGRIGVMAAVFNIVLNLLGIPLAEHLTNNGAIAAAIITVLTEVFMFVGAVLLIPKHLLEMKTGWYAVRIALAGAATGIAAALVLPHGLLAAVAAGAVAYAVGVVALRAIHLDDVRYVTRRFGARRFA